MDSFVSTYVWPAAIMIGQSLLLLVALLVFIAYILLADRKIWAAVQMRRGPNVVGPWGLFQSFADLLKFVFKEPVIPAGANKGVFLLAPLVAVTLALATWAVVPVADGWVVANINVGILYIFAISSLEVYGIIMGGWASNSKYALLGSIRGLAQLISYELSMGLAVVPVVLSAKSFSLTEIVVSQADWPNMLRHPLAFVIFMISVLAESKRTPFDLPEGENEIVAGYHTEYSGMRFGLFFVGEYINVIILGSMVTVLFLGGWHGPLLPPIVWFVFKVLLVAFCFIWTRGTLPRLRYDQLMHFGWKFLIPVALANVLVTGAVMLAVAP